MQKQTYMAFARVTHVAYGSTQGTNTTMLNSTLSVLASALARHRGQKALRVGVHAAGTIG